MRTIVKIAASVIAATALASPAWAELIACDSAEARDLIERTLPRAGDDHPIDVTFRTTAEGVTVPDYLVALHPDTINVILQYQFERLTVKDERIAVDLWFKGKRERLVIPFAAITTFYDRSVAKCRGQ
jgi:hypothetical protein